MNKKFNIRIGIDGRALRGFIQGSRTGVARYCWEICKELSQELPHAQFFVYSPIKIELPVNSENWVCRTENTKLYTKIPAVLWAKYRCGTLVAKDNLDVFWGSASFLPHLAKHIKTILTIYDLTYRVAPLSMELRHRFAFHAFLSKDIKRADFITTISKGTSERIKSYFSREVDEIIYPSIQNYFTKPLKDVEDIQHKLKIKNPFVLTVGTFEPRKNLLLLINSMAMLKDRGQLPNVDLVIVGGCGWKYKKSYNATMTYKWIKYLGFQDNETVSLLYKKCALFAFPSIYEGFGMPVLEARYFRQKIVTIDIPELREAGCGDALYAQNNIESFSKTLMKSLKSVNRKKIKLDWPTWRDGAKKLKKLIQE